MNVKEILRNGLFAAQVLFLSAIILMPSSVKAECTEDERDEVIRKGARAFAAMRAEGFTPWADDHGCLSATGRWIEVMIRILPERSNYIAMGVASRFARDLDARIIDTSSNSVIDRDVERDSIPVLTFSTNRGSAEGRFDLRAYSNYNDVYVATLVARQLQ
jgi:hypothetical protein